jgi:hypothetical protein
VKKRPAGPIQSRQLAYNQCGAQTSSTLVAHLELHADQGLPHLQFHAKALIAPTNFQPVPVNTKETPSKQQGITACGFLNLPAMFS